MLNKFKAWDKINKKFVGDYPAYHMSLAGQIYTGNLNQTEHLILVPYTGLKDMEGNEIYEGDILSLAYGIPMTVAKMKVVYKDYGFQIECWNASPRNASLKTIVPELGSVTIIGNIYENPEMDGE